MRKNESPIQTLTTETDLINIASYDERKDLVKSYIKGYIGSTEQNIKLLKNEKFKKAYLEQFSGIKNDSQKARSNIIKPQSINVYRAGEKLSPQETAQKIRNLFGNVESVKLPRSNGSFEVATRRSNGLFYFSGKNTPCYLEKGETVSKNFEKKESIFTPAQKVQVETRGKLEKLLPWNWGKGDTGNTLVNSLGDDYYANQDRKNNCGPTACAIAAARLIKGLNPYKLRDKFTRSAPGKMSWDTPGRLLGSEGLRVEQRSSLSPSEINSALKQGNVVLASVTPHSGLTKGGHITALTGMRAENQWVNADPNIKNIRKGLGTIGPQNLMNGGAKQYWIVSKGMA